MSIIYSSLLVILTITNSVNQQSFVGSNLLYNKTQRNHVSHINQQTDNLNSQNMNIGVLSIQAILIFNINESQ